MTWIDGVSQRHRNLKPESSGHADKMNGLQSAYFWHRTVLLNLLSYISKTPSASALEIVCQAPSCNSVQPALVRNASFRAWI